MQECLRSSTWVIVDQMKNFTVLRTENEFNTELRNQI